MTSLTVRAAATVLLACGAAVALDAQAIPLVSYSFGTAVANQTNTADLVAAHLAASPVTGLASVGDPVSHGYFELTPGSMAMMIRKGDEGGSAFHLSLTAQPGYTFQVTDAQFRVRVQDSAGSNRSVLMNANEEGWVSMLSTAGGDLWTTFTPGGFGWNSAHWADLVAHTDLTELGMYVGLKGNSSNTRIFLDWVTFDGNVFATADPGPGVPEPASGALAALALAALGVVRVLNRANLDGLDGAAGASRAQPGPDGS